MQAEILYNLEEPKRMKESSTSFIKQKTIWDGSQF